MIVLVQFSQFSNDWARRCLVFFFFKPLRGLFLLFEAHLRNLSALLGVGRACRLNINNKSDDDLDLIPEIVDDSF